MLKAEIKNADSPEKLSLLEAKLKSNDRAAQAFLNVAVEAYPNLKSIEGFNSLQGQLEGTENRISKARSDYNESIKKYNSHIRGFFARMVINSEEFPRKTGFEADKGAENKSEDTKRLLD
jgi:LemA protein